MITFVEKLQKDIGKKVGQIEASDRNILKKSLDASHVFAEAFHRLKQFIVSYTFKDNAEEIEFFKEIKPKFFYRLIYYRKVYNIEMNRPAGGVEAQKFYLVKEIEAINRYNSKRNDFVRYYRSGSTHLDSLFFLRGRPDPEQYLETFYYECDPGFSTNCDFKVARLLANDLLMSYLMDELDALDNRQPNQLMFPKVRLTWKGTKAELNEQLFAWDSRGTFGNVPLTQLSGYIQNVFNIELDHNLSRTFSDMRIRNNPTPYLDSLKEALLKRMQFSKWKTGIKNNSGDVDIR